MTALAIAACVLAGLPCLLFLRNLGLYRSPGDDSKVGRQHLPSVSVLIPARNEEDSIRGAVESVLASEEVKLEAIVLDDESDDATASIVEEIAQRDPRLSLRRAPALPADWCGKQHACAVLAGLARHRVLVFMDADVRLTPRGLVRAVRYLSRRDVALASGFPKQETVTFLEKLVLPLMHFLLLCYLPLHRMRQSSHPAYGAGCGQLFVAQSSAYEQTGGHGAIKASLHDGLTLPRSFRQAGFSTDLFDATDVARCRMYRDAGEVWRGLAKNATEGLGRPATIGPWSVILAGGQVLPLSLVALCASGMAPAGPTVLWPAVVGTAASYLPRLVASVRFQQSYLGALLHPLGICVLLAIQWYALGRALLGKAPTWKQRAYGPPGKAHRL